MTINNEVPLEIYELAQRYIDNSLTEAEAKVLLPYLEKNKVFREGMIENVLADFIIAERYDGLKIMQSEMAPHLNHISRAMDPLWDAVIAELQFSSRTNETYSNVPLYFETTNEQPSSFWWNSLQRFWSNWGNQKLSRRLLHCGAIVGGILVLITVILSFYMMYPFSKLEVKEEATACIDQTIDAVWSKDSIQFKRGQKLHSQTMSLDSGLVRLKFKNNTEVIMKGPSELVINDENNTFCNRGHVCVHVPFPKVDFRLTTPYADFIDYGTRFSVYVTENSARLDVIEGRVGVKTDTHSPNIITAPAASEVNNHRIACQVKADTKQYITTESFEKQLAVFEKKEKQKQQLKEKIIVQDENLAVRLDFSNPSSRIFKNKSVNGAAAFPEATRSNCSISSGILSEEQSISFTEKRDNVWFPMQTTSDSVTLVATVKIRELKPGGNVIFANDRFLQESGTIMWQILRDGRIQFHITPDNNKISSGYPSPVVITPSDINVWLTLAVVADSQSKEIRHYIDGRLVGRVPWPEPIPLNLGNAAIGNINTLPNRFRNAWFGGDIANFSLYDTIISEELIVSLTNSL